MLALPLVLAGTFSFQAWAESTIPLLGTKAVQGGVWVVEGARLAPDGSKSKFTLQDESLIFDYYIKALPSDPWPSCAITLAFAQPKDFSAFNGFELTASSSRPVDTLILSVKLGSPDGRFVTEYEREIRLSTRSRAISIPFAGLFPGSWYVAHASVTDRPNYARFISLKLTKLGSSGESGQVRIDGLRLYSGKPDLPGLGDISAPDHAVLPEQSVAGKPVKIEIDVSGPYAAPGSRGGGKISPLLFGADEGLLPIEEGKAAALGMKVFRLGGGTGFNWRNSEALGPDGEVHPMRGVVEFVRYCRAIHAEPLIEVNVMGYAPDEKDGVVRDCMDAADAADLVRYLNGELGLGVRYFQIDNEFEFWHASYGMFWKTGPCTADQYIERFTSAAIAMKAAQESVSGNAQDIRIVGPEISSSFTFYKTENPADQYGGLDAFPPYFLKKARELEHDAVRNPRGYRLLDILSFHLYPSFRIDLSSPYGFLPLDRILTSTRVWWDKGYANEDCVSLPIGRRLAVLPTFNSWIDNFYPGTGLAVTEFGIDADPRIPYDELIRVLYQAELYGILATYGVDIATQHTLDDDAYLGLMDPHGAVRPSFYPLMLYAWHFKGTMLKAVSRDSSVKVYACDDGEGSIVVMAINEGSKPRRADISISGGKTIALPISVGLEPRSLACIRLDLASLGSGPIGEVWRYGEAQLP